MDCCLSATSPAAKTFVDASKKFEDEGVDEIAEQIAWLGAEANATKLRLHADCLPIITLPRWPLPP
jgi:hypothetical protein